MNGTHLEAPIQSWLDQATIDEMIALRRSLEALAARFQAAAQEPLDRRHVDVGHVPERRHGDVEL